MNLYYTGISLKDPSKQKNGDFYAIVHLNVENLSLFLLADGVGGSAGDWKASKTCVKEFVEQLGVDKTEKNLKQRIHDALYKVNSIILNETGLYEGMKSTFLVAVYDKESAKLYFTGIGDSRIYKIRDKEIELLTTDQVKAVMLRKPDGELYTKNGSVIPAFGVTKLMGIHDLSFTIEEMEINTTTGFLMASDGFYKNMVDKDLFYLYQSLDVESGLKDLAKKVESNQDDDATAIFFRIEKTENEHDIISAYREIFVDLHEAIKRNDPKEVHKIIDKIENQNIIQTFEYYDETIKLMKKSGCIDGDIYQRIIKLLKTSRNNI